MRSLFWSAAAICMAGCLCLFAEPETNPEPVPSVPVLDVTDETPPVPVPDVEPQVDPDDTPSELDALREEIEALKATIADLEASQIQPSLVGETPLLPDAPQVPLLMRLITASDGKKYEYGPFVDYWYKRARTHPGAVEEHLTDDEHGLSVDEISGLSREELKRLHAALHEHEEWLDRQQAVSPPVRILQPQFYGQSCPGGVCPTPQRRGLFGWGRR